MVELKGFPELSGRGGDDAKVGKNDVNDDDSDTDLMDTAKMVQDANRKKKKSGGFQSMGLSQEVWRGVIKKGYKVPTTIQRKTVPLIMDRTARQGRGCHGADWVQQDCCLPHPFIALCWRDLD